MIAIAADIPPYMRDVYATVRFKAPTMATVTFQRADAGAQRSSAPLVRGRSRRHTRAARVASRLLSSFAAASVLSDARRALAAPPFSRCFTAALPMPASTPPSSRSRYALSITFTPLTRL